MLSRYIKIPLKEGTLIDITTEKLNEMRCVKYGVYNVYIECDDPVMFSTIKTNIVFSLVVKAAFITLVFSGMANLWMAVIADVGTSLAVILYGMRLITTREK